MDNLKLEQCKKIIDSITKHAPSKKFLMGYLKRNFKLQLDRLLKEAETNRSLHKYLIEKGIRIPKT